METQEPLVRRGGGQSAVVYPFRLILAGPRDGDEERYVDAEIDLTKLATIYDLEIVVDASRAKNQKKQGPLVSTQLLSSPGRSDTMILLPTIGLMKWESPPGSSRTVTEGICGNPGILSSDHEERLLPTSVSREERVSVRINVDLRSKLAAFSRALCI
ncbi:hypothetical protein GGX14DRAFT_404551 [Mycena pura]|uniref:Uncharacterized protein n=1 Tax=Mycena pura TaxID=153505 RepID=A0AAD6UXY4_9AGAR|nr:hypothetical protein GGX14DRAFT_404551 [Mycena pura]